MQTLFVLWATRKGDPDYAEQVIAETTDPAKIKAASTWAKANDFNRLRVMTTRGEKPDFIHTIRV